MPTLVSIVPTGLLSNVAVSMQSPLASTISQSFGMLQSIFSSNWSAVL